MYLSYIYFENVTPGESSGGYCSAVISGNSFVQTRIQMYNVILCGLIYWFPVNKPYYSLLWSAYTTAWPTAEQYMCSAFPATPCSIYGSLYIMATVIYPSAWESQNCLQSLESPYTSVSVHILVGCVWMQDNNGIFFLCSAYRKRNEDSWRWPRGGQSMG